MVPDNWYDLLGDADEDMAYSFFKELIETQVCNLWGIGVPWLSEAKYYNLNCCMIKVPATITNVKDNKYFYLPIGRVRDKSVWCRPEFSVRSHECWEVPRYTNDEKFRYLLTETHRTPHKEVEIMVYGVRKWVCPPLAPAEVRMDMQLIPEVAKPLKAIYVINEVFYTPKLTMRVNVGDEVKFCAIQYLPVGFNMIKYTNIAADGVVGAAVKMIRYHNFRGKRFLKHYQVFGKSTFFVDRPPSPPTPVEMRPSERAAGYTSTSTDTSNSFNPVHEFTTPPTDERTYQRAQKWSTPSIPSVVAMPFGDVRAKSRRRTDKTKSEEPVYVSIMWTPERAKMARQRRKRQLERKRLLAAQQASGNRKMDVMQRPKSNDRLPSSGSADSDVQRQSSSTSVRNSSTSTTPSSNAENSSPTSKNALLGRRQRCVHGIYRPRRFRPSLPSMKESDDEVFLL